MTRENTWGSDTATAPRASWAPMVAIVMAQILLVFNVTTLKVAIDGIAESFGSSPSVVKAAIVAYSLAVTVLIFVGAKIDEAFGARRMFRTALVLFTVAMTIMALGTDPLTMIVAQILAGAATGALVPALVLLIADNYRGTQRATALGWLAAAQAMGLVPGIFLAGLFATWPGWRYAYGALVLLALGIYWLSETVVATPGSARVRLDVTGLLLAAIAIFLLGIGCSNLSDWGVWWAKPRAPFELFRISPAPLAIVIGMLVTKSFFIWSRRHQAAGGDSLIPLEALAASGQRAALLLIFLMGVIGSAITFLIPLYIEIVQGRTTVYTAIALAPFAIAGFVAAVLVVRIGRYVSASRIVGSAFLCVAIGSLLLGATIRNDWSDLTVVLGMTIAGLGEGALGTQLFKLIAASAVRRHERDVAPLCISVEYLAAAVGTALSSALVIGVLAGGIQRELVENPRVPDVLEMQIDLDKPSFVSNDRLRDFLSRTPATPEQVAEAVRINTKVRLDALRICFFALAALAVLALAPAHALPGEDPEAGPHVRQH